MSPPPVAIFWDYENVRVSSRASPGHVIAGNIQSIALQYGLVTIFRAYFDHSESSSQKTVMCFTELQTSGLSLVDCPHRKRKDVADKKIIVDMLIFAMDHPPPATIILISGDSDFEYAVSTLRMRGYYIVLIAPKAVSASLESVASLVLHWDSDVLGKGNVIVSPPVLVSRTPVAVSKDSTSTYLTNPVPDTAVSAPVQDAELESIQNAELEDFQDPEPECYYDGSDDLHPTVLPKAPISCSTMLSEAVLDETVMSWPQPASPPVWSSLRSGWTKSIPRTALLTGISFRMPAPIKFRPLICFLEEAPGNRRWMLWSAVQKNFWKGKISKDLAGTRKLHEYIFEAVSANIVEIRVGSRTDIHTFRGKEYKNGAIVLKGHWIT
ncbi:hypothetical protein NEOLEDRAFT_1175994 [Neolentinus lepideus HHB14362 ss-1]|uniref:NYN domain-containing protein n=1 Tax=Neolentinus lepideus HHB14362 ss-1 TaxID=1314782 RepID=A0A165UJ25_9AGAM|nr:hypothetical protein NEOLEDRAFT_1175994 [Neolentinus lepideus HHB14362 ss-1]